MSKYIIDIPKTVGMGKVGSVHYTYFDGIQCQTIVLKGDEIEELNSDYINEHFGDLQDTAYQRGLDDAWEAARKLFSSMADSDIEKAFPIEWNNGGFHALINLQPQEAIEKLKAYEEKQKTDNRIEIGDEVYAYTLSGKTQPFIIIKIYDEDGMKYYSGINADGNHVQGGLNYIKTGRHFPHVVELLKAMKE